MKPSSQLSVKKIIMLALPAVAVIAAAVTAVLLFSRPQPEPQHSYVIVSGNTAIRFSSDSDDPEEVLREAGISLASAEYEVREDGDATVITVIHYPAVTVRYDGQEAVVSMREGTVADVLAALGIALAEGDRVVPGLDERITDGMTVEVERAG